MIGLLVGASASLGNRQIEPALTSVLRDDAFMSGAINALITVWLASQIKMAGWVAELKKLRANHKKHAFIRELTLNIALSALQSPATSDADAKALEKFVQEIYAEAAKGGVKARQMTMSEVQGRLRQLRTRAKLANASSDILALGAADDDDDDESSGGSH
jgi:hypothetical protein